MPSLRPGLSANMHSLWCPSHKRVWGHSCVSSALQDDPGPGQTRTGHFALACTVLHWEGPRASWAQPRGTQPSLGVAQSFWRWYLS